MLTMFWSFDGMHLIRWTAIERAEEKKSEESESEPNGYQEESD